MKNGYTRKTIDRWDIMTNYGYGWNANALNTHTKRQKPVIKNINKTLMQV